MTRSGDWVPTISLAVAVLAIPATIWATRRWGARRARVEINLEIVPILPTVRPDTLAVTFVDIPVPDPHLVTFQIRNVGPRDVASADFDGGKHLVVNFSGAFYGVTRARGATVTAPAVGARPPKASVHLGPGLLKRGDAWSFTAVVSGGVPPEIHSPLVDTDLVQAAVGEPQRIAVSVLGVVVDVPLPRRPRRAFHS